MIELGDSHHGNMVKSENVIKNLESYLGKLDGTEVIYL